MPKIVIDVTAGTAQLIQDLDNAEPHLRKFGDSGVSAARAAGAEMRILQGDITNNVRAVEVFLSKVLGLGPVIQKLFPVAGAIAFGGMLVEMGVKGVEAFQKIHNAAETARDKFAALTGPLRQTNDELAVSNQRLENEISKLEGKRQNTMALALLETKKANDELHESFQKTLLDMEKLVDQGKWQKLANVFTGAAGTSDVSDTVTNLQRQLRDETDPRKRNEAIDMALANLYHQQNQARGLQSLRTSMIKNPGQDLGSGAYDSGIDLPEDQTTKLESLRQAITGISDMYSRVGLTNQNLKLTGQRDSLQAGKDASKQQEQSLREGYDKMLADLESSDKLMASEKLAFRQEELRQIQQWGGQYKELFHELNNQIGSLSQEAFAEAKEARDKDEKEQISYLERLREFQIRMDHEGDAGALKAANDYADSETEPATRLKQIPVASATSRLQGTAVGRRLAIAGAGYSSVDQLQEEINRQQELLQAMQQGGYTLAEELEVRRKIVDMQSALIQATHGARQEQVALLNALAQAQLQMGTASSGLAAFRAQQAANALNLTPGRIINDAANSFTGGIADDVGHLVSHPNQNPGKLFGGTFQAIGSQMVSSSLKGIFGRIFGGSNAKPDGSSVAMALWVRLANAGGGSSLADVGLAPGNPGGLGDIGDGLPSAGALIPKAGGGLLASIFSAGGGVVSSLLKGLLTGARATGGPAGPGDILQVNEGGDTGEYFMPNSSGYITPSSRTGKGGGDAYYSIDARGTDPALVEQRVRSAIQAAHKNAIVTAVTTMNERSRRMPSRNPMSPMSGPGIVG